jgi:uncharacterized membrane protein
MVLQFELVVFFVCTYPEPVIMAVSFASQGTVTATDLDGVDFTLLSEAQRGVPRIISEQRDSCPRASERAQAAACSTSRMTSPHAKSRKRREIS